MRIGQLSLVVAAVGGFGAPAVARAQELPLEVMGPLAGEVLRDGKAHVVARCPDDPACALSLSVNAVDDKSVGLLDVTRELGCEQTEVQLLVSAVDSQHRHRSMVWNVFVECSPYLREVMALPLGEVLDFDGQRALVRSPDQHQLWLVNGAEKPTSIFQGSEYVRRGDLHRDEAYFVVDPSASPTLPNAASVRRWNGQSTTIDASDERVAGDWLALVRGAGAVNPRPVITLRDLGTGQDVWTSEPLLAGSQTYEISALAVAEDGDVFWQELITGLSGPIGWRRDGTIVRPTPLGEASGALRGLQITPTFAAASTAYPGVRQSFLYSVAGAEHLCESEFAADCPPPTIAGDWVGYGSKGGLPTYTLLRRQGAGKGQPITGFQSWSFKPPAFIEAIDEAGKVLVRHERKRYLETPGANTPVCSELGQVRARGGKWYLLLGRSVFEISSTVVAPSSDAGVADAGNGAADAGEPLDAAVADAGVASDSRDASSPGDAGAGSLDASSQAGADAAPTGGAMSAADDGCNLGQSRGGMASVIVTLLLALRARRRRG